MGSPHLHRGRGDGPNRPLRIELGPIEPASAHLAGETGVGAVAERFVYPAAPRMTRLRGAKRQIFSCLSGPCRGAGAKKMLWRRENGAQGRNRTTDTAIFSRMLYQLSYLGPGLSGAGWPAPSGGGRLTLAACPHQARRRCPQASSGGTGSSASPSRPGTAYWPPKPAAKINLRAARRAEWQRRRIGGLGANGAGLVRARHSGGSIESARAQDRSSASMDG